MNINSVNLLLAQNPDFKFVKVIFAGGTKEYTYKTFFKVEEGDIAVVEASNALKKVKVIKVLDPMEVNLNTSYTYKWLVDVIQLDTYVNCMELEAKLQKEINVATSIAARQEMLETLKEVLPTNLVCNLMNKVKEYTADSLQDKEGSYEDNSSS